MGLFTAVRDPGVRGKLAEACQPGSSNPSSASHIRKAAKPPTAIGILLSCAKKNGVGRQEELAQRKPLKGFPLDSFPNRGARPLWHPELPGTDSVTNRACSRTFEYWVVGSTTNLQDPTRRKANFLWKFLCAEAAFSAMRSPVPHCSPPRKDFCRAKMPCGGQVFQICCSAVKSSDFLHASRYLHARKRVLPKYVEDARLGGHCKSGTPGISKGPQPFCFRKSPEKTLLKGFLWATSSRRLDTALLCAAKKRGVEIKQAGRLLPV